MELSLGVWPSEVRGQHAVVGLCWRVRLHAVHTLPRRWLEVTRLLVRRGEAVDHQREVGLANEVNGP